MKALAKRMCSELTPKERKSLRNPMDVREIQRILDHRDVKPRPRDDRVKRFFQTLFKKGDAFCFWSPHRQRPVAAVYLGITRLNQVIYREVIAIKYGPDHVVAIRDWRYAKEELQKFYQRSLLHVRRIQFGEMFEPLRPVPDMSKVFLSREDDT